MKLPTEEKCPHTETVDCSSLFRRIFWNSPITTAEKLFNHWPSELKGSSLPALSGRQWMTQVQAIGSFVFRILLKLCRTETRIESFGSRFTICDRMAMTNLYRRSRLHAEVRTLDDSSLKLSMAVGSSMYHC